MAWNPNSLKKAATKAGVSFDVDENWLTGPDPYGKGFQPVGIVLHHTATGLLTPGNMPSLEWCRNPGIYAGEARACQVVVGRDGSLQIIAGRGAYHAGAGGPYRIAGNYIPKDLGNRYLIGIEIEAHSSKKVNKKNRQTPKTGINPAQWEAVTKFCAALLDDLGWDTSAVIRHRDWAPNRKIDIGLPLDEVRDDIEALRKPKPKPKPKAPAAKKTPAAKKSPAKPKAAPKPIVRLRNIKPAAKNDEVLIVQKALKKEFPTFDFAAGKGLYGPSTKAAYKRWQKSFGLEGAEVTGIPDIKSLRALGKKYGFTVRVQ